MDELVLPEGRYIDIHDGYRVHYHDVGEGPPVVFLHGSGPGASGYSNFKENFPILPEAGFRALVPDSLGYGYSSMPTDVKYHLWWLVEGLEAFLDTLGVETASFVGNSMGGAMAIWFALECPERVDRLVLMAPGGLSTREEYMEMEGIRTMMAGVYSDEGVTPDSIRRTFELQLFDASQITQQTLDERYAIAKDQPSHVLKSLRVPALQDELHRLEMPILALWGKDDKFCPVSGARRIAEQCPQAEVRLIDECGHWVMVEHRDLFNEMLVDFLGSERA
jgi:4,5:9,10-diseco-3-hydroxy-5,9,17-trioxoandrosta-1(10),2-diene-4-oate hydrolase